LGILWPGGLNGVGVQLCGMTCSSHLFSPGKRGISDTNTALSYHELLVLAFAMILAVLCLGFYALHKIKPGWLRIHGSVSKLITFSMEIGQAGAPEKPRENRDELEAGHGGLSVLGGMAPEVFQEEGGDGELAGSPRRFGYGWDTVVREG
jgi:hypothetical protein